MPVQIGLLAETAVAKRALEWLFLRKNQEDMKEQDELEINHMNLNVLFFSRKKRKFLPH